MSAISARACVVVVVALIATACEKAGFGGGGDVELPCEEGSTILVDDFAVLGDSFAIDSTHAYFTKMPFGDSVDPSILRVPLVGGAVEELWKGRDLRWIGTGMAIEGYSLYFPAKKTKDYSRPNVDDAELGVYSLQTYGGSPVRIADLPGECGTEGVALDAQNVYVACFGNPAAILRVSRRGGLVSTLWSSPTSTVEAIGAHGNSVYFSAMGPDGGLFRVGADVAQAIQVAPVEGHSIAFDADTAYVLTSDSLVAVPLDGGDAQTLATSLSQAAAVAVDPSGAYVGTASPDKSPTDAILRVTREAGAPVPLLENVSPWTLALGSTSVYWSTWGQVGRVGKCSHSR
jgi:hypothetical protein